MVHSHFVTHEKAVWQHGELVVVPWSPADYRAEEARYQKALQDAAWLEQHLKMGDIVEYIDWRDKPARDRVTGFSGAQWREVGTEDWHTVPSKVSLGGGNAQAVYYVDDIKDNYKVVG